MKTQTFINTSTQARFPLPMISPGVFWFRGKKWDRETLKMIGIHESPVYQPYAAQVVPPFGDPGKYQGYFKGSKK